MRHSAGQVAQKILDCTRLETDLAISRISELMARSTHPIVWSIGAFCLWNFHGRAGRTIVRQLPWHSLEDRVKFTVLGHAHRARDRSYVALARREIDSGGSWQLRLLCVEYLTQLDRSAGFPRTAMNRIEHEFASQIVRFFPRARFLPDPIYRTHKQAALRLKRLQTRVSKLWASPD